MGKLPVVLTIASSDNSGGAGVQMDLYAFNMLKVHGCSVVTGITAQNSREFRLLEVLSDDTIGAQLEATLADYDVKAVKTGMLAEGRVVGRIADRLKKLIETKGAEFHGVVVDVVLGSTVSGKLEDAEALADAYRTELLPAAFMATPNLPEAEALLGRSISSEDGYDIQEALKELKELGAKSVLLKGGHITGGDNVTDRLLDENGEFHEFTYPRQAFGSVHGTGCMLSALISAHLAMGYTLAYQAAAGAGSILHDMLVDTEPLGSGELRYFNTESGGGWQMHRARTAGALRDALKDIEKLLTPELVPEVGINFGYAIPAAKSTDDICALDTRIVKSKSGVNSTGGVAFGVSSHVARIILAAMSFDLRYRSAVNLRYSKELVEKAKTEGFSVGTFSRAEEPEGISTMEWGTKKAIADLGFVPDVIFDLGGVGKEPMVRLLGQTPSDVAGKLRMFTD